MRKIAMLLALCLVAPLYAAGQYTVSGRVMDGVNDHALPGAHVVLKGSFKGVFADRDGRFVLGDLEADEYVIEVSFMGYEPKEQVVRLEEDLSLDFYLEPNLRLTEEVVVSALRAGGRNPVTYTNLNAEELTPKNLGQDLPMLLSQTPSLITSSDAGSGVGYTWMNIRGSDQSRINITMNGIPLNDQESHGVWWVNMPDIVSSVDNLQVQRGVGLSTHGAGAFGATINLHTTALRDEAYAEINSSAGSFNTIKNTVSFGTGLLNDKWVFDGRLSGIDSDGYVDRASADLKSFYLSGGYHGDNTVIKGVIFSGKETTYQAWYGVPSGKLESDRTYNPAGLYENTEGDVRFYDNETDNYQQDHYQLHISRNITPGLVASTSLFYVYGRGYYEQFRENEQFSRYDLPVVEIGDEVIDRSDLVRRRWLDNDFYGLTYSLNYNNYEGLEMVFGGGYNEYDGDHFGEIIWARYARHADIRDRYYDNNGFKQDFNTFTKATMEVLPDVHAFADLQYRYVSYTFLGQNWVHEEVVPLQQKVHFNFFNPKAGVSWEINPANTMYVFGGIGNREPVRRDFTESSPDSRPTNETLRNLELGYEYSGKQRRLGVNFYLMDYDNQLILTGEINDVGGFSRTNIDDSYRLGIELEGAYRLNDMLDWSGNLTLSRNKIAHFEEYSDRYDADWNWVGYDIRTYEDTDIAFSPSVIGASTLRVTPVDNLSLSVESKYVGDQYIDNTMDPGRKLDAYFVNSFRMNYILEAPFFRELELILQVNNLFNVAYETNAWVYKGVVGDQGLIAIEDGYFPQAGRHFMAGLNLRF